MLKINRYETVTEESYHQMSGQEQTGLAAYDAVQRGGDAAIFDTPQEAALVLSHILCHPAEYPDLREVSVVRIDPSLVERRPTRWKVQVTESHPGTTVNYLTVS